MLNLTYSVVASCIILHVEINLQGSRVGNSSKTNICVNMALLWRTVMSDGGGERLYGDYSCGDEQHFSDDSLEGAESRPLGRHRLAGPCKFDTGLHKLQPFRLHNPFSVCTNFG